METKLRRLDHKNLVALLLVITRMIKADSRIDANEIEQLMKLERLYGFDHTMMQESTRLTLAEALAQLKTLERPMRQHIMQSLTDLATSDHQMERHEALLLVALSYCLLPEGNQVDGVTEVVSSHISHRGGDLGTYMIYYETEADAFCHQQIDAQRKQLRTEAEQNGMQLLIVEHIVESLCQQDPAIVKCMLHYLSPSMTEEQIEQLYIRMTQTDTVTFAQRILVRNMQLNELRTARPSLLINLSSTDFLRIELGYSPIAHIRQFLSDYSRLASPAVRQSSHTDEGAEEGHFSYYSYYRDLFNLMVEAEPKESRIVVWPNKSEFEFPTAGRKLKLNHQEAALYTTILYYTYYNKGVPLCYTKEQRAVEALYRTIYCRKKCIETADVIYPDNLAPIRAKIEKKMRDQLDGLDNLEDFIPRNENREGYYRIAAPVKMVRVRPDIRLEEVSITEYKW